MRPVEIAFFEKVESGFVADPVVRDSRGFQLVEVNWGKDVLHADLA